MADLWREMPGVYPHHSASFRIQVSGQLADEIFIVRAKAGRIREELVKKIHEQSVTICSILPKSSNIFHVCGKWTNMEGFPAFSCANKPICTCPSLSWLHWICIQEEILDCLSNGL